MIIEEDYIYCGVDIFASSFFMLTRWEELVLIKRINMGDVMKVKCWLCVKVSGSVRL